MKTKNAFTILELLIAIAIFSVVSVISVWLIFSSLSLRDQTLAATRVQEQLRVFSHTLREAIQNSSTVSGGGGTLQLKSANNCWSFLYDGMLKNVRYSQIVDPACTPDPVPQNTYFSPTTSITSLNFTIIPLSTGGRTVSVSIAVKVTLPFDDYQTSYQDTFTNLID